MSRAVLVAVVALAVLAGSFLLLRPPDTGADIPERTPVIPPAEVSGLTARHPDAQPPRAEMVAKSERRKAPDAQFASVSASAWTGLRRELSVITLEPELSQAIEDHVRALRAAYQSPDPHVIAQLAEAQPALVARVRALPDLPATTAPLFARLDEAAQGLAAPDPEPTP